jgi:hypothetical protein
LRIEIDDETAKVLDQIRKGNYYIGGKGHADTVRFLARFYQEHKSIEKLLEENLNKFPAILRESFREVIRDIVTNLMTRPTENGQETVDPRNKHR